jgi:hypothetical protein
MGLIVCDNCDRSKIGMEDKPMTEWKPINEAPKDGTEFQMWAVTSMGNGYWIPLGCFMTQRSNVPSAYMFESGKWIKMKQGQVTHFMPLVNGPDGEEQLPARNRLGRVRWT